MAAQAASLSAAVSAAGSSFGGIATVGAALGGLGVIGSLFGDGSGGGGGGDSIIYEGPTGLSTFVSDFLTALKANGYVSISDFVTRSKATEDMASNGGM